MSEAGEGPAAERETWREALPLYEQIEEPYSIGQTARRLARVTDDPEEKRAYVEKARACWASIEREDLVRELQEEFGEE